MKALKFLPLACLLAISGFLYAKPLDIDVILDLLDSRVSEASIQRFVERNHFTFHLAADDLMDLKKAGASDTLIEFLQQRESEGIEEGEGTSDEDFDYGTTYSGSPVYMGYEFGYPYAYYSSLYYPAYSFYYPYYPCTYYGGTRYYVTGQRSRSGTGVYSYWYRNHSDGRTRFSRGSGSFPSLSGRVSRFAPSGSASGMNRSGRPSGPGRSSWFSHSSPRSGMGGGRGSHGGSGGRGRR